MPGYLYCLMPVFSAQSVIKLGYANIGIQRLKPSDAQSDSVEITLFLAPAPMRSSGVPLAHFYIYGM